MKDLPPYDEWRATRDTLHAHSQVLGKLAVALAPPEPQLQHAALRLTARGFETQPLPVSGGALVVSLDLRGYAAVAERSDGRVERVPLTPDRAVGEVTRDLLAAVRRRRRAVEINMKPQEVDWSQPLDEDDEHEHLNPTAVDAYLAAATGAAQVPRGHARALPRSLDAGERVVGIVRPRCEPVLGRGSGASGGRFHHAQRRRCRADRDRLVARGCALSEGGVLRICLPVARGVRERRLSPEAARWDADLGEFILDSDGIDDALALQFAQSAVRHACAACGWDPALAASAFTSPRRR